MRMMTGLALVLVAGVLACRSGGGTAPKTTDYTVTVSAQANGQVVGSTPVLLKVLTPGS
jgi:hypothetical protein